jgi:putative flavoprotein involved in K+ transport
MVRRYRGRDAFEWLSALGDLDAPVDETRAAGTRGFPLSGLNGGEQLDLGVLRDLGVVLAGRLAGFDGSTALFGNDLEASVAEADARMRHLLGRIDAHCAATGEAHPPAVQVAPVSIAGTLVSVDLAKAGIGSIVWATGFQRHFPWLHVPGVLDAAGDLVHRHGVTPAPGLYALGLRFQRSRSSHIIGGVGDDAAYLAERIVAAGRVGRGRDRGRRRAIGRAA